MSVLQELTSALKFAPTQGGHTAVAVVLATAQATMVAHAQV